MPNLKDLFPGLDPQDFGSGSAQVAQWAKGDDTSLIPADKLGSVDAIKTKLDGIEDGAEVNVNADWNSTSGDSQILNLPNDLATEGYVNTQVASLVNTAPEALDTLNELAAALGDDPNFATTTSTLIGDNASNIATNASDIDAVETRLDTIEAFDYVETDHTGDVSIDGNVGIGTTSPSAKLDVNGNIQATGARFISSLYDSNHYMRLEANSSGGVLKGTDGGVLTTLVRSYGDSYLNGGNVGIGTSSPGAKLQVTNGTAGRTTYSNDGNDVVIDSTGSGTGMTIASDRASHGVIYFADQDNGTRGIFRYDHVDNSMRLGTDGGERMRIDSSGNVGIGTDSPGEKLEVNGTIAFNSLKDTAEDITITKFVDEADGLANNDNDTTIPTSAAIADHVATEIKDSYEVIGLAMDYMSRVHNDGGVVEGMGQVMKNTEKLILS